MKTLRQAAEQALEALKAYGSHAPNCDHLMLLTSLPPQRKPCSCGLVASITALKEALAQREWVGLANEEVKKEVEIEMKYYWDGDYIDSACAYEQLNNFVRTIEAKLKEKNT